MAEYLVLISASEKSTLSAAEEQHCVAEYGKWAERLGEKHVTGRRLGRSDGTHLPSKKSPTTDGPFAEAKELIAGVIIIQADSQAEAAKIANECPLRAYFELFVKEVN